MSLSKYPLSRERNSLECCYIETHPVMCFIMFTSVQFNALQRAQKEHSASRHSRTQISVFGEVHIFRYCVCSIISEK